MINYRDMSLKIIADMATEQLNEIMVLEETKIRYTLKQSIADFFSYLGIKSTNSQLYLRKGIRVLWNKVKKIKCNYAKIMHKVEKVKKCHGYNDRIV